MKCTNKPYVSPLLRQQRSIKLIQARQPGTNAETRALVALAIIGQFMLQIALPNPPFTCG
jgi:hypothetical protein